MRTIEEIDADIDTNRGELLTRRRVLYSSAKSWQKAWDANPDLKEREDKLFRERGAAQLVRDTPPSRRARAS